MIPQSNDLNSNYAFLILAGDGGLARCISKKYLKQKTKIQTDK